MAGDINSKISSKFKVSDIERQNYGKLDINGFLDARNLKLDAPKDSFLLEVAQAGFRFGANEKDNSILQSKSLLNAIIGFDGLKLSSRFGAAEADNAHVSFKTSPLKDTTAIATIATSFNMARLNLTSKDSIYLRSGEAKLNALIGPDKKDKKVTHLESDLYCESVIAGDKANIAYLKKAGFKMASSQSKTNKKHWISNGDIGFESLKMFTREFPLLITMPTSHISLEDDMIRLHNAGVNIGNSDLKMQGRLSSL